MNTQSQHKRQADDNRRRWERKPLLKKIYRTFFEQISSNLARCKGGQIVEIGSGIGFAREIIPDIILTDIFPAQNIHCAASTYRFPFIDESISDIVMVDVFHHLRYPGNAFDECNRILMPGGRISLLEPYISIAGLLVYGLAHKEPLGLRKPIQWHAQSAEALSAKSYFAAQANASRIFCSKNHPVPLQNWKIICGKRYSAISYILSGGYSGPQLYPEKMLPFMRLIDSLCDMLPGIFATRLHVVLQKDK